MQKKEEENPTHDLENPARVADKQRNLISFVESRYTPILPSRKSGICFLKDSQPSESDNYLGQVAKAEIEKPLEKVAEESPNKEAEAD